MLTTDQAHLIAVEGEQQLLREYGTKPFEALTLLEFLVCIAELLQHAKNNNRTAPVWQTTDKRIDAFQRVAGLTLMALRHHGDSLHTTHQLQRSLHPQQAGQRTLLLEHQFTAREAGDAFHACYDAALNNEPFNRDNWTKLRSVIQKLGAKV